MRVVKQHHDATPHWHLLLFMVPHEVETVTDIFQRYDLAEDGDKVGADCHRFQVEHIDPNKDSAVGYIAKYIAKNIEGECVGADLYGKMQSRARCAYALGRLIRASLSFNSSAAPRTLLSGN